MAELNYGEELGGLLYREAEREESFQNVNMPNTQNMEWPLWGD